MWERLRAILMLRSSIRGMAWVFLLAAMVGGYVFLGGWFGRADLSGNVVHAGGIAECELFRRTCLVDGNSGWQDGVKWRMLNIDAPEMGDKAGCDEERDEARASLDRLTALMAGGYSIRAIGRVDKFGRQLVDVVLADGRNGGSVLQSEALALPWTNEVNLWCYPVVFKGDKNGAVEKAVIRYMHSSDEVER